MKKLPDSKIVLREGCVVGLDVWTLWNGEPAKTICIKKLGEKFSAYVGDPEHGGRYREGNNLSAVLMGMHANVISGYEKLFSQKNPDPEILHQLFPGYVIEVA